MSFLFKPRSHFFLVTTALILAGLWIFFLLPDNFTWMGYQSGESDTAQHLAGWYAYVQEPWHFPLLEVKNLNYPIGTTISLTDSIPLFALIFKLLRHFLPAQFNYFGVYIIFCYFTQALSALCLSYSLRQKNLIACILFVGFALSCPVINYRVDETVCCQSILLLALSLYFFTISKRLHLTACHIYFGLLLGVSLLVHPYLTAMAYPFYIASLFSLRRKLSYSSYQVWIALLIMHLSLLLFCLLMGLGKSIAHADGFGYLTSNLSSLFYGGYFAHYKQKLAYGGQDGGFAYLGLGLMILCALALFLQRASLKSLLYRFKSFWILMIFFFILAIYGSVYLGTFKILVWGVPHFFLTYDFRDNGRFIWPVWYCLMAFSLITVLRSQSKFYLSMLPLLLALQIFDTWGYLRIGGQMLQTHFTPLTADSEYTQAQNLIKQSKIVIFYPRIACPNMTEANFNDFLQVQLMTARAGIPINTAYIAHLESSSACSDQAQEFNSLQPRLLVSPATTLSPTIQSLLKSNSHSCQLIAGMYYCQT